MTSETIKRKCKTEARRVVNKRYKQKIITEKKFYCIEHNYAFDSITTLNKHLVSRMHNPEKYIRYHCELCNYHTKIKCLLIRHQQSKKHQRNISVKDISLM